MAEPARTPRPDDRAIVRPLSRAAARRCSRPGCPTPATATLAFAYDERRASLRSLTPDAGPETYDLCRDHADRTSPPHGWSLDDQRPDDVDEVEVPEPEELGSAHTVAVLAAALRGEAPAPDPAATAGPSAEVDVAALDAIAEAPLDDPPAVDLFSTRDEADPVPGPDEDALGELSALAAHVEAAPEPAATPEPPRSETTTTARDVAPLPPARTVPGANRG